MWMIYRRAVVFPLAAFVFSIVYVMLLRQKSNLVLHSIPAISRIVSEEAYFNIEMKMRFIFENFDHRVDFLTYRIQPDKFESGDQLEKMAVQIRKRAYKVKAEIEKQYLVNKHKSRKLLKVSADIQEKLSEQQDAKCRMDNIAFVSLQQGNCGFGCHLHTLSVGLLISYYWEKTLVYAQIKVPGMQQFGDIFMPIAKSCRFHDKPNATIISETIRPYEIIGQGSHSEKIFRKFYQEVHELVKFHSDPVGFIIGQLMAYIMRYNETSTFFKNLQASKARFNMPSPYVGVHVRRSDKSSEALFYEIEDYMRFVDEFYGVYFIKHPEKIGSIQKTVYVASDDETVFKKLETKYPAYKFNFNSTFTKVAGSYSDRYSQNGFESILFDLYFLSQSDHLVCTFTSNICRLAYELRLATASDTYRLVKSLDTHYFNHFGQEHFRIAVLDNNAHDFRFKKGRLIKKKILQFANFEGYRHDGFIIGELQGSNGQGGVVASYKTKDFY